MSENHSSDVCTGSYARYMKSSNVKANSIFLAVLSIVWKVLEIMKNAIFYW